MKKRSIVILLMAMMVTLLTGCGEKVTAESLIEGTFQTEYVAYDLAYVVESMSVVEGYDMGSEMVMELEVVYGESIAHLEGVYSFAKEIIGEDFTSFNETKMDIYRSTENGIESHYDYKSDYDIWTIIESDRDEETYIPVLTADMFEDLELEETKNGYEVTGLIDDHDAINWLDDGVIESFADDLDDCDISATLVFDEEKVLESYEIVIEVDEDELYDTYILGEVNISEFKITAEFKEYEDELEVPKDIEDEALTLEEAKDVMEKADAESEDEGEAGEETTGIPLGVITDTTYENETLGIRYEISDANWRLFTREEIDAVYNASIAILDDGLGNVLANATSVIDLYAMNTATMANLNMTVEYRGELASVYTEDMYIDSALSYLPSVYEGYGFEDVVIDTSEVVVLGETHRCIITEYTYMGMRIYQAQVILTQNDYSVIITSGSYTDIEEAKSVFANFYRIGE